MAALTKDTNVRIVETREGDTIHNQYFYPGDEGYDTCTEASSQDVRDAGAGQRTAGASKPRRYLAA